MSKSHIITITEVMNTGKTSALQKRVIILCFLIGLVHGFDTQTFAFASPALAGAWGVEPATFSGVFAISLVGTTIGAAVLGPLADRFGRRRMVLICLISFSAFTLLLAFATTMPELLILKFLAALGAGGIIPNMFSLGSEFATEKSRSAVVTFIAGCTGLGGMLGSFLSAWVIPEFGWQSIFIIGGAIGIFLGLFSFFCLPESARFLVSRGEDARARKILHRINGSIALDGNDEFELVEPMAEKASLGALFTEGRARVTTLFWVSAALSLLTIYGLANWLPVIITNAGHDLQTALIAMGMFNLGGMIGSVTIGLVMDRLRSGESVLLVGFLASAVLIVLTAISVPLSGVFIALLTVAGAGIQGAFAGVNALITNYYPTNARAAATGWATAIAHIGSIAGPTTVGVLIATGASPTVVMSAAAIPMLLLALCMYGLYRLKNVQKDTRLETDVNVVTEKKW